MAKAEKSKLSSGVLLAGLLIVAMASFLLTRHCYPDTYYEYVDKDGTACFTDSRQTIPEEHQKKAIKMTDEIEYGDKKLKDAQIKLDNKATLLIYKKQELPSEEKKKAAVMAIMHSTFFRPVVAIAISLSLFIFIGKIGRFLGHQQIISVLRIALTAGLLVFLLHARVEKMAGVFNSLKTDVNDIAERAEERVQKAEETTKDLLVPANVNGQAKMD